MWQKQAGDMFITGVSLVHWQTEKQKETVINFATAEAESVR